MNFLSEIFGFDSDSNKVAEEDVDDSVEYLFSDMVDDITKTFRRKLSWCKFKGRQFQRHAQSQTCQNERRKMYERRHTIAGNENIITSNDIPKSLSGNVILEDKADHTSRLYEARTSISDRVDTSSNSFSRQISADSIRKIASNDLPKSGIPKSRSDSAIWTHLVPRVTKNEVEDRVATKLSARRKEFCGMTSSHRVAFFRNKYGLHQDKN